MVSCFGPRWALAKVQQSMEKPGSHALKLLPLAYSTLFFLKFQQPVGNVVIIPTQAILCLRRIG